MATIPGAEKVKPRKILYVGDDQSYWFNLQKRYLKQFQKISWEFICIYGKDPTEYQAKFIEILEHEPAIIYIDFSTRLDEHLTIANFISRENTMDGAALVGLVPDKGMINSVQSSGVNILHIKCGEFHDVVWQAVDLTFPIDSGSPGFAVAKTVAETRLFDDFRIGYFSSTYAHCEGNLRLNKGDIIELESDIPEQVVPSKFYIVKHIDSCDLYYDFKYSYDLEYVYVDEPDFEAEADAELIGVEDEEEQRKILENAKSKITEQRNLYKNKLKNSKKEVKKWIVENSDRSSPKITKILIVDKSLSILRNEPQPVDKQPYTFRFQTELKPSMQEIDQIRPNIIAIQFMGESLLKKEAAVPDVVLSEEEQRTAELVEEKKAEEADMAQISRIVEKIKGMEDYQPFVIVFNSYKHTSKSLQDGYQYPLVMAHKGNMEMSIVLHMSQLFEAKQKKAYELKIKEKVEALKKKDPNKYRKMTQDNFKEKRYYVSKKNPLSFVSTSYPIELEAISESEVTILTDFELEKKTYRLKTPCSNSISIVPHTDGKMKNDVGGKSQYRGLIHTVGEEEKQTIRKYVNEIFFQPLSEERKKDKDAFKELNEKVSLEIDKKKTEIVAEKKAKEEEKKAEKEAAKEEAFVQAEEAAPSAVIDFDGEDNDNKDNKDNKDAS
jgi:hypothetical protein